MIINLKSGPRNVSIALMYSFAQRNDTIVKDDPFCRYYLKLTGIIHSGIKIENTRKDCISEKLRSAFHQLVP